MSFPRLIRVLLLCVPFSIGTCFSQENIFTAGFQYKPIFSSSLLNSGTKTISQNKIDFSISPHFGYSLGMVLRRGINKRFSVESGINFTKRNFALGITDTSFTGNSDFSIIGYEIPLQGLVFIRLGEKFFMNAAAGVSWDMYPSSIYTEANYFRHRSSRNGVFQGGVLANLGYEYRTEKSGYFYLGASYHLPFTPFYSTAVNYTPKNEIIHTSLRGNYLTLDFRYFFHEDPLKPKAKKKKKN